MKKVIYVIVFIVMIIFVIFNYRDVFSESSSDETTNFAEIYEYIETENNYLNNLLAKDYDLSNSENPYIPDGFRYVEGTVEEGYVIEDDEGNQFVWVPCNSETLYKKDFSTTPFISIEDCWEENYEEFLTSALENGGFYVSRYETGIENEKIVSKSGVETLVNITRTELEEKVDGMYENSNFNVELINGYAYDRMILWAIEGSEDIEIVDLEIYEDEATLTGRNSYKNVYDIFDDMFEITAENYLDGFVYRGYTDVTLKTDGDTPSDFVIEENDNRWCANEKYTYANCNITSRLVLYK